MNIAAFDARSQGDSAILNQDLLFSPKSEEPVETVYNDLARDIICLKEKLRLRFPLFFQDALVIGLGHSMGGASLALASKLAPNLFDGLVLIEPIIFPQNISKEEHPLYQSASKRQYYLPSKAQLLEKWRNAPVFQTWAAGVLEDYIEYGTMPSNRKSDELMLKYGD